MQHDELQRRVRDLSTTVQDIRLGGGTIEDVAGLAAALDEMVSLFWDHATGSMVRPESDTPGQGGGAQYGIPADRRDAGLRQLGRVVRSRGEARLRLDTRMLDAIRRDTQTALLSVDNEEALSDDQIRTLLSHLDHLGSAVRDVKSDLNKVNWAPLLRRNANAPDSRGYCCESCECCIGTYQNFQDQWLCADCADCGSCPRQRMRRPLGEAVAGVIEPRVAQIRTQIEMAVSDAVRLDRAAMVPEGDTRGK